MLIESIIKREGGTTVTLDGATYKFALPKHVAEVADVKHATHLLSIKEGFREVKRCDQSLNGNVQFQATAADVGLTAAGKKSKCGKRRGSATVARKRLAAAALTEMLADLRAGIVRRTLDQALAGGDEPRQSQPSWGANESRTPGAMRMQSLRARRRRGVRCCTIEFGEGSRLGPIIHAMVSRRILPVAAKNDPDMAMEGIYAYLDRCLNIRSPYSA